MQRVPRPAYPALIVSLHALLKSFWNLAVVTVPAGLPHRAQHRRADTAQVPGIAHDRENVPKPWSIRTLLPWTAIALGVLTMVACGNGGWQGSAPAIIVQPADQTVTVGQRASFAVTATGVAPMGYQWYRDRIAIRGANSSSYTTPATEMRDNAALFSVTVFNAGGSVASAPATLTVNRGTPVASSLVCSSFTPPYHGSVTLVPTFSGGTAVIGSAGVGSSDITATAVSGDSYSTPAVTSATTYTLSVTGAGEEVASTTCSVTPRSVSVSAISPAGTTMAPGQQSFAATVSGGATNNLTWSASGGTFQGNIWTSPSTAGSYTITATSVDDPSVSSSTTATVSLPVITGQPVSLNVCPGGTASFTVTADYAESYQWMLGGSGISGATGMSYNIAAAAPADAGIYSATVGNGAGSVTSNVARLVVGSSITSNPASLSVYATQTATFSVSAEGQSPFSYQWYVIPSVVPTGIAISGVAGSGTATAISGATSSTYTTPAVDTSYDGAQYYATVTDACGGTALTSSAATLTVTTGNVPPTITTEPVGQAVAVGATPTFSVVASGTPALSYQWYRILAGGTTGVAIAGANSASYTLLSSATTADNDQDAYYVIVSNAYGQAVSEHAPLAVGDGILLQITGQPQTAYVNEGAPASFTVTAASSLPLTYQWYRANPGSSTFAPITRATSATYTLDTTASTDTGSVFLVIVSNGSTASVSSQTASLFVGTLAGIDDLCSTSWTAVGDATSLAGCSFQLTAATTGQHGEIVWPGLISTGNIQLSFTVAISDPSSPPADGFAMVLGDPSLGATPTSTGATGQGLGAEGIPGFVLGFDTYHNTYDPTVPYLGVGRSDTGLWENPWFNVNTNIPALASSGTTVSHDYAVSIVQGQMTVTMDGAQVFSGKVMVPPVAYLYVTASTGGSWEKTVISNLTATVSAPSN